MNSGSLSIKANISLPTPTGKIYDDFELDITRGEIVALMGPSGCGKTTLIRALAEHWPGVSPHLEPGSYAVAFQEPQLLPWRTVESNAMLEAQVMGETTKRTLEVMDAFLTITGLESARALTPDQLSVGMEERVQFVRAIVRDVSLFLFDEPLGSVDWPVRREIAHQTRRLIKSNGFTGIWITHDPTEAKTVADRIILLGGRPVASMGQFSRSDWRNEFDEEAPLINALGRLAKVEQSRESEPDTTEPEHHQEGPPAWLPLLPLLILLMTWEALATLHPPLSFFVSSPTDWISAVYSGVIDGSLTRHAWTTLREALWGLAIGGPLGLLIGIFTARSDYLSKATRPYLVGLTAIPLFVLAPVFILWFGIGFRMKVAIAAASCVPFMGYLVHDILRSYESSAYHIYLQEAGGKKHRIMMHLTLPWTAEAALIGLRPAMVASLLGAFLGEFVAASEGLGYFIVLQSSRYRIDDVFAGVFMLFTIAVTADFVSRFLSAKRNAILQRIGL